MKEKIHHTTGKSTKMRYTPPHIWTTGNILYEPLLVASEDLKTTVVKDDYADYDGRSNNWDGFDPNESGSNSSLWDE